MTTAPPLRTIGELARHSGVPVRTIRFYSDRGLVPPAARSDAGYRLYDEAALARLELVRSLRELGVDLPTMRRVLARELTLAEVAAAQAAALDAQIRILRLRRGVLAVVAKRHSNPEEIDLMHRLARLTADERGRIVADFVDHVFDGVDADPGIVARMRATRPQLPDDPMPAQLDAWIELAELVADDGFRRRIRAMADRGAADRAAAATDQQAAQRVDALVSERAGAALAAGIDPASPAAAPVLDDLAPALADAYGRRDGADFRPWLAETIETFADARAERYWELLGTINGWPKRPRSSPAWGWLLSALRPPGRG